MKIAIFDPRPRICGPTTFGFHIQHGFRQLGHQSDVVSFTKSGKPYAYWGEESAKRYGADRYADRGIMWHPTGPDLIAKWNDATEVLNAYDFIFLVEPACLPDDKEATREFKIPEYVYALAETKTPWTSHIHGAHYDERHAPFFNELFQLKTCAGITSTRQWHLEEEYIAQICKKYSLCTAVIERLPYSLKNDVNASIPFNNIIGLSGRMTPNKGIPLLLAVIEQIPSGWTVRLRGPSSVARSACYTYEIFEYLTQVGFNGEIQLSTREKEYLKTTNKVPTLKPHPWRVEKNRVTVEYDGGSLSSFHGGSVNLALTSARFQREIVEYTGLEALDAGTVSIHPAHQVNSAPYSVLKLEKYTIPPTTSKTKDYTQSLKINEYCTKETLEEFTQQIRVATTLAGDQRAHRDMAISNRKLLAQIHTPVIASRILLELFTKWGH